MPAPPFMDAWQNNQAGDESLRGPRNFVYLNKCCPGYRDKGVSSPGVNSLPKLLGDDLNRCDDNSHVLKGTVGSDIG